MKFKKKNILSATDAGFLTATDIADYLVNKGVPFRDAHGITGSIVKYCIDKDKTLMELELKELKKYSEKIGSDIFKYISLDASVDARKSFGGTAAKTVLARIKQIKNIKKK